MPACQECHRAKKTCDRPNHSEDGDTTYASACSRCTRLGIPCIARISRQGQGPKKKRQKRNMMMMPVHGTAVPTVEATEDGNVLQAFLNESGDATSTSATAAPAFSTVSPAVHYGIRYLIHSWTSFAFARRSFALLERACHLAAKCHVPMNDIFCKARQHILQPILYGDAVDGTVSIGEQGNKNNPPLQWSDVPPSLRSACRLFDNDDDDDCSLQDRYIMLRQAKQGHSRYLASRKFQQDICSTWVMEQTWKANTKPVVQVFLQGPTDFAKFTKAIHYQMSRYTHPNKDPLESCRINGLNVIFTNHHSNASNTNIDDNGTTPTIQEMDLVYTFEIVTLEHSWYVCEFVHPKKPTSSAQDVDTTTAQSPAIDNSFVTTTAASKAIYNHQEAMTTSVQEKKMATASAASNDPPLSSSLDDDPFMLFDNLPVLDEDFDDQDFEAFLALIND